MLSELPDWPENSPEVTFDINLGKEVEYIDFDPYKYNALLDALGTDEQDKSKLQVIFKNRVKSGWYNVGGLYDSRRQTAHIKVEPGFQKWTNETLLHETQHFIDDMNGAAKINKRSEAAKILAGLAVMDASIDIGTRLIDNEKVNNFEFPAMFLLTFVAVSLYSRYRYKTDPQEVRARKTEKNKNILKHYGKIVTVKPKQSE